MAEQTFKFEAEVSRLLGIVARSLYSEKDIFLRELISNASDACDRLRYAALAEPGLAADDPAFRITVALDRAAKTVTVTDNGIGMTRAELVENLGTIARSGTAEFLSRLSTNGEQALSLIGQFGVGFYSAFMVASRVDVLTRKAGEEQGWRWSSDGKGAFTVAPADAVARGTAVTLHLDQDNVEFLDRDRLGRIVRTYSDHIAVPVSVEEGGRGEVMNTASALWTRPRTEIDAGQYREFYRHVSHAVDEPWLTLHWRAEGMLDYRCLLFVPRARPFDLFVPERQHRLKLYVRRVFVTDACAELLPAYLRFLQGVVDTEDLPLNVSREMLQSNPVVRKIRVGIVKRVLAELERKAEIDAEGYRGFWANFGGVLKEGIYEEPEHRGALLGLARFRSSAGEEPTRLADYVSRMKPGQEAIYTLCGEQAETLLRSPHLEGFRARGVEVLLLTDPIDEFWIPAVGQYEGKPFRSASRGAADLEAIAIEGAPADPGAAGGAEIDRLIALLRLSLKDEVKDVRRSGRLRESAVCLVADDADIDLHLERLLSRHGQIEERAKRILEINAAHPLIRKLGETLTKAGRSVEVTETARLLLDQALIVEGETPRDPAGFAARLSSMLERSLAEGGGGERGGSG
jgi:molecular chaperone HtpG